ncbi:MAG: hypothetical protein ACREDS_07985 [Limisphaerales bacterium]
MTKKNRNCFFAFFIVALPFLIFLGFLIYYLLVPPLPPLPPIQPLPNPNGYDDLVKAGQMVSDNTGAYESLNESQLRELVSANAEALSHARTGLSNECRVPLQFSQNYLTNHIHDEIGLRNLAQAFVAEGKLAEKENRFGDAAKSYLDAIRLGNESARGGTIVDGMIGVAINSLGAEQLQKLTDSLDEKSCRETTATLEILAAQRQTWADIMQQEDAWSRRTFSSLHIAYYKLLYYRTRERNYQRCIDTIKSLQHDENQLIIDLAARAYELDKGHLPASAADLVPDYLKAVPQDPFTGTNMVYSPR